MKNKEQGDKQAERRATSWRYKWLAKGELVKGGPEKSLLTSVKGEPKIATWDFCPGPPVTSMSQAQWVPLWTGQQLSTQSSIPSHLKHFLFLVSRTPCLLITHRLTAPLCLHHWLILPRQTLSFRAWPWSPSLSLVISFSPVVLNTTFGAASVNPCIFRPDPSSELQTLLTFSCHTWHCPLGINRNLPLKFQHRTLDNFQCSTNLFCPCVFFHLKVLTIGCSNQTLGTTQLPPLSSHPTHGSPLVTRLPSSNSHTCCGFFHLFLSS